MKKICFYSYDSIDNPWCGGGGAYRDLQVLLHQREQWDSITMIVGNYPGFKTIGIRGIRIRSLGLSTCHLISRITYTLQPNISEEKKRELLQSCLFFCSPSRFEGWGIAALEANAAGKAVLVTETEGFNDSIKRGFSGLFIPPNDLEALVGGLKKLMEDTGLREQLGTNGRTWAAQFSWENISRQEYEWIRSWFLKE